MDSACPLGILFLFFFFFFSSSRRPPPRREEEPRSSLVLQHSSARRLLAVARASVRPSQSPGVRGPAGMTRGNQAGAQFPEPLARSLRAATACPMLTRILAAQRDIDRARAEKRNAKKPTQHEKDGLTPLQRKERCAPSSPPLRAKGARPCWPQRPAWMCACGSRLCGASAAPCSSVRATSYASSSARTLSGASLARAARTRFFCARQGARPLPAKRSISPSHAVTQRRSPKRQQRKPRQRTANRRSNTIIDSTLCGTCHAASGSSRASRSRASPRLGSHSLQEGYRRRQHIQFEQPHRQPSSLVASAITASCASQLCREHESAGESGNVQPEQQSHARTCWLARAASEVLRSSPARRRA